MMLAGSFLMLSLAPWSSLVSAAIVNPRGNRHPGEADAGHGPWMDEKKFHAKFGDKAIQRMFAEGKVIHRSNPDQPKHLQYAVKEARITKVETHHTKPVSSTSMLNGRFGKVASTGSLSSAQTVVEPSCHSWCAKHAMAWQEKCAWKKATCSDCSDCKAETGEPVPDISDEHVNQQETDFEKLVVDDSPPPPGLERPDSEELQLDDRSDAQVVQLLNINYSRAERFAEDLTNSMSKMETQAISEEGQIGGAFHQISSQVTEIKARIGKMKINFDDEFQHEKEHLHKKVEDQHENNSQVAAANKQLSLEVADLQRRNAAERVKAEQLKSSDERLQVGIESLKENLTTLSDYISDALNSLDDSNSSDIAVLQDLEQKESLHRRDEMWRKHLEKLGLPAPTNHHGSSKHKVPAAMAQVAAQTINPHRMKDKDNGSGVAIEQTLTALTDTIVTLQSEHKKRMIALNDLYSSRLNDKIKRYKKLIQEKHNLINQRRALKQTHANLMSASAHLEAVHSDLDHRSKALRGYAHKMASAGSK